MDFDVATRLARVVKDEVVLASPVNGEHVLVDLDQNGDSIWTCGHQLRVGDRALPNRLMGAVKRG